MKKVKKVSVNELEAILRNANNSIASFVQLMQVTEPKTLKKDRITKEINPYNKVLKVSILSVIISTDYKKGVENQLVRENKDTSEYKRGVNSMPLNFSNSNNSFFGEFIDNKGVNKGWVLQYRPFEKSYPSVKYIADGNIKTKENMPDILPAKSKATNQGTEKEILWRKVYLKNIKRIHINGIRYKVVQ